MIDTVYLDIDGVLSNFNKRAFETLGLYYDYNDPALQEWNWYKYFGLTFEELDSVCTVDFWASLPWMHDGRKILEMVEANFDNVYLLTTPMPNPGSYSGKMLWVKRHIPKYYKRTIITQVPKHHFAGLNVLLIDDKTENVEKFSNHGYSTLINRPWNTGRDRMHHTVEDLKKDIFDIVHDLGVQ